MRQDDHAWHIVPRPALTASDRVQIDALVAACSQRDGADWSIVTSLATTYDGTLPQPLYERDGKVLGLVALQAPDAALEAIVLVHPAHRRRGIGKALLAAARIEGQARRIPGVLLTCDEAVTAGIAFARAAGATYRSSEHRMAWSRPDSGAPDLGNNGGLERVTSATLPEFVRVSVAAFGHDAERARNDFARALDQPGVSLYLARLDGEAVGGVRTAVHAGEGWITALGVTPSCQGRGLGRRLLLGAVEALRASEAWPILLEVATDNRAALNLYHACGFQQISAYAYFHLAFSS